jgi:hypothetical protein
MKKFNEFLSQNNKPELEQPNLLQPQRQTPMSITSVDRNGEPIVHDMELVAQYFDLQKVDILELYADFIENVQGLYADFIEIYHYDLLVRYNFDMKKMFAEIWTRTSPIFQHDKQFFLFGIIVRDFKHNDHILREALQQQWQQQDKSDDDDSDDDLFA